MGQAKKTQKCTSTIRFNDVSLTKNGQNRGANATEFDDLVTSDFLRSLTSLQVLDNLAEQADRHGQNFFADITAEGKLGKVQAIDNDFSFSDITMDWDDSVGQMGGHAFNILNKDHDLRVPYMDKALAERIAALEETDRKAVMADVLEPWAFDTLCTRFGHVKRAIRAELESEDTHHYLDSNANWKSPEVMEKLKSLTDKYGVTSKRGTNYVSNFLLSADLTRFGIVGAFDYRGFLNADYEAGLAKAALKEVQDLNDEEKAAAKPQEFGVSENVISYLKETRQPLAGPALFKRPPPMELSTPIVNKILAGKKARRQPPKK